VVAVAEGTALRVEPVFAPPEHSSFLVLSGPVGSVDGGATDSSTLDRRVASVVDADQLRRRFCVIGEDEAGNRGAPQELTSP